MGMSHNDNRLTQIKTDSEILSHYKNTLQPYPTLSPIFLSVTSVVVCFCWPTYSFRCPHIDSPLEGQLKVRVCNADFCNEVCSRCLYLDLGLSFLVRSSFFWIQAERMQDRYSVVRTRTVLTYTHNHNHNHTHTWHTFFPPPHTHIFTRNMHIFKMTQVYRILLVLPKWIWSRRRSKCHDGKEEIHGRRDAQDHGRHEI